MPKEVNDPMGYEPRSFRLQKKWVDKIAQMPMRADGSRFVRIQLKNDRFQNAIIVQGEYIEQHVVFRDDDIVDITHIA